eukprot:TRINITY_DN3845_c0_g2_i1.p1 TRINITY_DN3845_c0_g2~~TRINITY_DN3845_c0_g2_i1.p1  ORF type:complete len:452 (+),score=53.82 TRINITY_DN3845_c0_g2_i1:44-1399(+)
MITPLKAFSVRPSTTIYHNTKSFLPFTTALIQASQSNYKSIYYSKKSDIHLRTQQNLITTMATNSGEGDTNNEDCQHSFNKKVVICGGGIIGCSIAYYLSKRGVTSTIIERSEIACAASGKAGGFLARDWNNNSAVGKLSEISYDMHQQLAQELKEELGVDVEYRKLDTLSVAASPGVRSEHAPKPDIPGLPDWIDGNIVYAQTLGSTATTAQVHPYLLTTALIQSAQNRGAKVVKGEVAGIKRAANGVSGVLVDDYIIEADIVVIAMGPWSKRAKEWVGAKWLNVSGHKYHSVVVKPNIPISAHALFTNVVLQGQRKDPEVYPRPSGEVYLCGEPETLEVPFDGKVVLHEKKCETILQGASLISSSFAQSQVLKKQACFLPIPPQGVPLIGSVPECEGVYIATGHSCWGILNAPATGLAMSQLIVDDHCTLLDLTPFEPSSSAIFAFSRD